MREDRNSSGMQEMQLLPRGNGSSSDGEDIHNASIGELFKRLSSEGSHLIQQEIQLAKTELQESAAKAGKAGVKIGLSVVLALPGVMALIAALVIGLGIIINSYWLSALIVGVGILALAGVLAKRAIADFKSGLAPKETVKTVREDMDWAKRESQRVKQTLSA